MENILNNDCPTQENLQLFLSGGLQATERETLELHLPECADCRRQLALMFTENAEEKEVFAAPDFLKERMKDLTAGKTQPQVIAFPTRRKNYFQWAIAAALIICFSTIAVYVFRQTASPNRSETFRQGTSNANSMQLLSPADGANISAGTIEFGWTQIAGAKSYALVILDEKGDIIVQKSTTQDTFTLDISETNPTKGKSYFWFVKANLADGGTRESHIAKFIFMK